MFRMSPLVRGLLLLQLLSHQVPGDKLDQVPRSADEPCRGQTTGKFVKDRYACDKFFYCGPNNEATSVDCPQGMIFNDEKEICDFPWNYLCVAEKRVENYTQATKLATLATLTTITQTPAPAPRPPTPLATKAPSKPTLPPRTSQTTQATVRSTISRQPPSRQSRCPAKDSRSLKFLADEDDCHRYYVCYHGQPMPLDCIDELHWNSKLQRCDFPEKAGCAITTTTTTESMAVMPPLMTTASPVATSCPARGEEVLPHPEKCNYFIYCVNGFPTVQQCPFFHHFDVQSKSCMWQTVAKCAVNM